MLTDGKLNSHGVESVVMHESHLIQQEGKQVGER